MKYRIRSIVRAYRETKDKEKMLGFIKSMIAFKTKFNKDHGKDIGKDKQLKVFKESLKIIENESKTKELQ